jgi:CobQ-like glutamine amidotransferase family enzyme
MTDLVIVHLYPDLLRTYGDRGNVLALYRRAEWRGFSVRVDHVSLGDRLPVDADVILLGGGTDRAQIVVGPDLAARRRELREAVSRGTVVIGVCGGYQFLGTRYVMPDGQAVEGLSLLDVETVAPSGGQRIIGRVRAQADLWGSTFELFGFENHGGRTSLAPSVQPLASVPRGRGNNGRDGTEGAVQGTVVGTYLHGPVLPVNPALADALLARALAPRMGGVPLQPLDDELERRAHRSAGRRERVDRWARPTSIPRRAILVALLILFAILLGSVGVTEVFDKDDGPSSPTGKHGPRVSSVIGSQAVRAGGPARAVDRAGASFL